MTQKRERTGKEKDAYALARIEQLLDDACEGKSQVEGSRLKAMEIRYSRLRPTLSAVEQTNHEEQPQPEEMMARLTHLFSQNPALLKPLLADPGFRAAVRSMLESAPVVVDPPQTPSQEHQDAA